MPASLAERTPKQSLEGYEEWEDANERGLVESEVVNGRTVVRPTFAGLSLLKGHRPQTYDELQRDG